MSTHAATAPPPLMFCRAGVRVLLNGRHCTVESVESFNRVVLVDEVTRERVLADPGELVLAGGQSGAHDSRAGYSVAEMKLARGRAEHLMRFVSSGQHIGAEEMNNLQHQLCLSKSQIYSCIRKLRDCPNPMALLRQKRGARKGQKKLDKDVEAIVKKEIKKAARSRNAMQIEAICSRIDVRCDDIGKQGPCVKTVRARIESDQRELLLRKRLGIRRAKERTSPRAGKVLTTEALAVVEIDHSPLDIILVSSDTREPIGRAFLTIVQDTHTRAVLGFYLGLDEPQEISVALALVHAILPKEPWLAERRLLDVDWPMYGLMQAIRTDKGAEFLSRAFRDGCAKWGINATLRNKKEDGGIVERLIGTIQARASQEPGATGSDPKKQRGERAAACDALMTLQEAEIWLAREIAMRYHYQTHGETKMSPRQAWQSSFTGADGLALPPIVTDAKSLLIDFLPYVNGRTRVIGHDGIHALGDRYYSIEIAPFIKPGVHRSVKFHPHGTGRIFVDPGTGSYIEVRLADPNKPDLPLFELNWRKRRRQAQYPNEFDAEARRKHEREQAKGRQSAKRSMREARRQERLHQSQRSIGEINVDPRHQGELATFDVDYSLPPVISVEGEL